VFSLIFFRGAVCLDFAFVSPNSGLNSLFLHIPEHQSTSELLVLLFYNVMDEQWTCR